MQGWSCRDLRIGRHRTRHTRGMTPIRIAAWSGPRNISTAMMRAWENREDCVVSDEPMYAHYLQVTQLDHPARDEVIAAGDTDLQHVVDTLRGPVPGGRAVWYQKHMSHHLLPGMDWGWVHAVSYTHLTLPTNREV